MSQQDTMEAARAEAQGAETSFTFDGESYTIPPTSKWDLDVLEAYEDGKILSACRALLGDDQWTRFRRKPRDVSDLNALFDALQRAAGIEGNS